MRVVGRSVGWLIFSLALNTHVPFSLAASGGYSPFLPFFFVGPLRWELSVFQNSSTRTSHGPYDVISLFSHFVFFHSCFFFFFSTLCPGESRNSADVLLLHAFWTSLMPVLTPWRILQVPFCLVFPFLGPSVPRARSSSPCGISVIFSLLFP